MNTDLGTLAAVPYLLPQHIAIVMDGNGRWAQAKMLPRVAGHHKGVEALRKVIKFCTQKKLQYLTLFAFSSENWQRPITEVKTLMALLNKLLVDEIDELKQNNIKLKIIGDQSGLNIPLQRAINYAEQVTSDNTGLQINVAINYSGKWDLRNAMHNIANDVASGKITAQDITDDLIQTYLSLAGIPDPDLLIRTSGEQRISNFLLWHLAYAELYFTPILWPDFDEHAMHDALIWYATRNRRFGAILPKVGAALHA